jgi:hypothetical protein
MAGAEVIETSFLVARLAGEPQRILAGLGAHSFAEWVVNGQRPHPIAC